MISNFWNFKNSWNNIKFFEFLRPCLQTKVCLFTFPIFIYIFYCWFWENSWNDVEFIEFSTYIYFFIKFYYIYLSLSILILILSSKFFVYTHILLIFYTVLNLFRNIQEMVLIFNSYSVFEKEWYLWYLIGGTDDQFLPISILFPSFTLFVNICFIRNTLKMALISSFLPYPHLTISLPCLYHLLHIKY